MKTFCFPTLAQTAEMYNVTAQSTYRLHVVLQLLPHSTALTPSSNKATSKICFSDATVLRAV